MCHYMLLGAPSAGVLLLVFAPAPPEGLYLNFMSVVIILAQMPALSSVCTFSSFTETLMNASFQCFWSLCPHPISTRHSERLCFAMRHTFPPVWCDVRLYHPSKCERLQGFAVLRPIPTLNHLHQGSSQALWACNVRGLLNKTNVQPHFQAYKPQASAVTLTIDTRPGKKPLAARKAVKAFWEPVMQFDFSCDVKTSVATFLLQVQTWKM